MLGDAISYFTTEKCHECPYTKNDVRVRAWHPPHSMSAMIQNISVNVLADAVKKFLFRWLLGSNSIGRVD